MDVFRQKRMVLTFYLFFILFIPIMARLADIQLAHGSEYAHRALEQRSMKVILEDIPRGDILDRNLKSLTGTGMTQKVVVFPSLLDNPHKAAETLADILGQNTEELIKQFSKGSGILPYPLRVEQVRQIKEANQQGIMVLPVQQRYYNQPLATHVVGHLGSISSQKLLEELSADSDKTYQLNDMIGVMGLEKYYEQQLKATQSERVVRAFADAAGSLLEGMGIKLQTNRTDPGRQNVVTTLDSQIQRKVEQVMDEDVPKGAVVVMDVHTGDIVAMASRPNFSPDHVSDVLKTASSETFVDHCTSLYQPGSIFKVIVAAAALEEGLVNKNTTFICDGEDDKLIKCWNHQGHGRITFSEAFAQSCNPVFAELGLKLGADKLIEYASRFGMDNQTVIGYPVHPDNRQDLSSIGKGYNLVNSSIGQGPVLTTPVQITTMMNTIINGGTYIPPRLVRELRKTDNTIIRRFAPGVSHKVISKETAQQVRQLLTLVVKEGVGKKGEVPNYGSAGKTGSAEVVGQEKVNAWFSGYAPERNPRYVVTVLVEQGVSGGESAAPVFKKIMEQILHPNSVD